MFKRLLVALVVIVVIAVLAGAAVIAFTFLGRKAIEDGLEHGSVRVIKDGFVSLGIVDIGNREVALIDAGNDESGGAIFTELRRRGLGAEAVKAILLTHGHPDHRAAVGRFPQAVVMALSTEEPLIAGREKGTGPLSRWFPASPTGITVGRLLSDGDTFTVGTREFIVFAVPGHTRGSAAYLVDEMLFIGDSADTDSNDRLSPAAWVFSDDQAQNRESLGVLAEMLRRGGVRVHAVVPAHSGPMMNGSAELDHFAATQR